MSQNVSKNHQNVINSLKFSKIHQNVRKSSKKWSKSDKFLKFLVKTVGATSLIYQCSPSEHRRTVTVSKPLENTKNHEIIDFS